MTVKDKQNQDNRWRSIGLIAATFLLVSTLLLAVESVSAAAAVAAALSIVVVGLILLKIIK